MYIYPTINKIVVRVNDTMQQQMHRNPLLPFFFYIPNHIQDQSGAPLSYEGSYVSRVTKSIQSNSVLRFTNGHFVLEPVNVIVQGLRNDFAEASKGPKRRLLHTPESQRGHCAKIGDNKCESSSLRHDRGGGGPMDTALGGISGHMGGLKAKLQKMGSGVEKSKDYRK